MLQREKLDILSICTWPDSHLEIAEEAVKHGVKAIYCEKPITNNLRKADVLVEVCEKNRVILAVNHLRRWDEFHRKVREFIQQGKLGKIQTVNVYYTAGISNTGTHILDLLRYFFGEVNWVLACGSINEQEKDPTLQAILSFQN